jgi:23S rRNA U2552 (ribose-2'-O)-methylase RlmE/FtsJ
VNFIKQAKVFVDVGAASDGYYTLLATRLNKDVIVLALEPSATEYKYSVHSMKINKVMKRVLCLDMGLSDHIEETIMEGKRVKFVRLDDLVSKLNLESVDIIKIDVEGAGALVIKGAEKIIEKHKPIIFFEVHNKSEKDIIKQLAKRGYKVIREPGEMYVLIPVNTQR